MRVALVFALVCLAVASARSFRQNAKAPSSLETLKKKLTLARGLGKLAAAKSPAVLKAYRRGGDSGDEDDFDCSGVDVPCMDVSDDKIDECLVTEAIVIEAEFGNIYEQITGEKLFSKQFMEIIWTVRLSEDVPDDEKFFFELLLDGVAEYKYTEIWDTLSEGDMLNVIGNVCKYHALREMAYEFDEKK